MSLIFQSAGASPLETAPSPDSSYLVTNLDQAETASTESSATTTTSEAPASDPESYSASGNYNLVAGTIYETGEFSFVELTAQASGYVLGQCSVKNNESDHDNFARGSINDILYKDENDNLVALKEDGTGDKTLVLLAGKVEKGDVIRIEIDLKAEDPAEILAVTGQNPEGEHALGSANFVCSIELNPDDEPDESTTTTSTTTSSTTTTTTAVPTTPVATTTTGVPTTPVVTTTIATPTTPAVPTTPVASTAPPNTNTLVNTGSETTPLVAAGTVFLGLGILTAVGISAVNRVRPRSYSA